MWQSVPTRRASPLVLALLLAAPLSKAASAPCFHDNYIAIVSLSECPQYQTPETFDALKNCLLSLTPTEDLAQADVQKCFLTSGCSAADAQREAERAVALCDQMEDADLRRRAGPANHGSSSGTSTTSDNGTGDGTDDDTGSDSGASSAPADPASSAPPAKQPTTAKAGKTTNTPQQTQKTAAPTTTAQTHTTQPTTDSTQALETIVVTEPASSDPAAAVTSAPLTCLTTTTETTTHCTTTVSDKRFSSTCYPTVVSYATCAAGLRCSTDQGGNPVCMRAQTDIGTSGTIVALFFAVAITIAACLMIFFACRERRTHRRLLKAAEAAEIARINRKAGGRPSVVSVRSVSAQSVASRNGAGDDRVPLVAAQHGPSQVQYRPEQPHDPFSDTQYRMQ